MGYSSQQRNERILKQVYEHGRVTVKGLAAEMAVSDATIRRDLRALADAGELELVYGGATLKRNSDFSFRSKATRNVQAKRIIGRLAAELVTDNDQIFIDSGTTCFEMVPFIRNRRGLSIIVNSVRLTVEFSENPGISVITLGGHYRPDRMDTVGPLATNALDQLRGYIAFVGADGLSMDFGLTAGDIDSAHLYRLASRNAREVILLADHAKFLTPSLCKIVDWDAISRTVTDRKPDAEWTAFLESKGIDIICPSTPAADEADGLAEAANTGKES